MTHSESSKGGTWTLIMQAALDVLRDRVRQAAPSEYRDHMAAIGVRLSASEQGSDDLDDADLDLARLEIKHYKQSDTRERCEALTSRVRRSCESSGFSPNETSEQVRFATMCAAYWFCGWTSLYDDACDRIGYPKTWGFAPMADSRHASWNPEGDAA